MSRKGPEGFETFYAALYQERWPSLRASLLQRVQQVARPNQFTDGAGLDRVSTFERRSFVGVDAFLIPPGVRFDVRDGDFYVLDPASIFPARALEVQEGDVVADFCAAPGGKTLILSEALKSSGRLVSNELSDSRRGRLRAVIADYVPASVRERIRVTGHDATRWVLYEDSVYDRILLDAPCSGERHLLANAEEMAQWSPARSKNLAVRQYALLASALGAVKPGGRIVYSTCSLSNLEDDAVIARLLKKRAGEARVLPLSFEIGEPTEHGWMILPDKTGFGPIYFSVLERLPVEDAGR